MNPPNGPNSWTSYQHEREQRLEDWNREKALLLGADSVEIAIPALTRASSALLDVSRVLESISLRITKIGTDTARAIGETTELKRHLRDITAREQETRKEVQVLQARIDILTTPVLPVPEMPPPRSRKKEIAAAIQRMKAAEQKTKRRRGRPRKGQ